jgi:hypothetical protein
MMATFLGLTVFAGIDGTIRHVWSGEMAEPGQDPRGAPDLDSTDDTRPHTRRPRRHLVPEA